MKKIGIIGGAFDPPHIGHFLIARDVLENLDLEEIYFLVSYKPPHREVVADFEDRLKMVELSLPGKPFYVSDFESKVNFSPTYTSKVLEEWRKLRKNEEIFFIMGSDQFKVIDTWYNFEKIFQLSRVVVCKRKEELKKNFRYKEKAIFLDTRVIDISSREIRKRIKEGKSIHLMVHPEVESYIIKKGLYK